MSIRTILTAGLLLLPGLAASEARSYPCVMLDGDGHGTFRDDLTTQCRYHTKEGLTFHYHGHGDTGLNYDRVRSFTAAETELAGYWLKRQALLKVPTSFNAKAFLQAATDAQPAYVLEIASLNGHPLFDYVYKSAGGRHYVIRLTITDLTHVPDAFWYTK